MSWEALNLRHLDEQPSVEPTLCGLIYLGGTRHAFTGPPESAKTIAAHAVALEYIRAGGGVLLVDLEMGPRDTRDRLREMGATDGDLDRLVYVEPETPATPDTVADLVDRFPVELAIVDAAAGAYNLQGLDDNRRGDVEKFAELMITPLRNRGISSIVIDHVVKKSGDRGGWAIGSERKLGFADVSLGFSAVTQFGRGRDGLVRIRTNKDRAGHIQRPTAAELVLRSDPVSHAISWEFREPQAADGAEEWRPTALMERVSRFLEKQAEAVSRRAIETNVKGKTDYVRQAIDCLVREEFAAETDGPYNPLRSVRPFRENDAAHDGSPQLAPDAPTVRPEAHEGAPPSPPSPEGGRGGTPETGAGARATGATDPSGPGATNPDVPAAAGVRPEGAPCRFPTHRDSDWVTADGRVLCGICHPRVTDIH